MRILCVTDSLGSGGAQSQLVTIAIGFKELGHDVSFLVYHKDNFFHELLNYAMINVHLVLESNYIKRLLKMRSFIRKGNYHSILSFQEAPNFICEIAGLPKRKWKLIVGERSANPEIYRSLKLRLYRYFHLFADHVVANSFANIKIVQEILPFYRREKLKVIYNIVDFEKWKPSIKYVPRKNGKFSMIIVSNHQYIKNAQGLAKAVSLLPMKYREQLIIHWYGRKDSAELIDTFNEVHEFVLKCNLQDQILFFDPNLAINQKITEYDALGLFSLYEGLPNSVCEAMASGKPVIATDVSDNKLIIDHGITGLIIKQLTPESMRDSLIELLDYPNERLVDMGNKALEKARKLFDKEIILFSYLKILN